MRRPFPWLALLVFVMLIAPVTRIIAQSTPVNFINVNFSPITTSTSYNYDWSSGTMTLGTATASVSSTQNVLQNTVSGPAPPDPYGYGTFIGTARPVRSPTGGGAVLFEQSVCADGYPTCIVDGSLTFGDMVMYPLRGATLDELTNLQTDYYVEHGCFGGGSPGFPIVVSHGTETGSLPEIHVYVATDAAGLRWDTSQLCPGTFYNLQHLLRRCCLRQQSRLHDQCDPRGH